MKQCPQRIELAAERTLVPAQTRKTSVQKIKNKRAEIKPDGRVKKITGRIGIGRLQQRSLENFQRCRKPAKQISRRHQIWQEIYFRWLFVHRSGRRAMIVDPPKT